MIHPLYNVDIEDFVQDYHNLSVKELMNIYSLSKWKYDQLVKKLNLPPKTKIKKLEEYSSNEDLLKIQEQYKNNVSIKEISRQFNVSDSTIHNYLKRIGLKDSYRAPSFNIALYVYLVNKGWLKSQIRKEFGLTKGQLDNYVQKYGLQKVKTKDRTFKRLDTETLRKRYYEENKTLVEICEEFSISEFTVRDILRKKLNGTKLDNKQYNMTIDEAIQLYVNGETLSDVSEKSGYPVNTLRRNLEKLGIEIRDNLSRKFKYYPYHSKTNGMLKMRSNWEVLVAKYLDMKNLNWKYEIKSFRLGERRYHPDFFICSDDGEIEAIIEVKGWIKEDDIRKINLFQILYPEIPIYFWDEEVIKEIEKEVA